MAPTTTQALLLDRVCNLNGDELEALNRIVNAYLEFAELQALNRKAMYMADWIAKLDDFLRLSERQILRHAGRFRTATPWRGPSSRTTVSPPTARGCRRAPKSTSRRPSAK